MDAGGRVMDMVNTPFDMCKDCFVQKRMEKLDRYDNEYYFACYDCACCGCACWGCADLHSCTGQCAVHLQQVN